MPENNNKKKGSRVENKLPQQEVSIKVKGQDAKQAAINQGNLNKKEPKGKEEGRSGGGLFKGVLKFIKGIFTATIDMPQQGQFDNRDKRSQEDLIQPESVRQGEWLNLSPETKQKAKKAAEGLLKEEVKLDGRSDRPIEGMVPNQTPPEAKQEKSGGKQIG
ncbi:hypothetical protein [Wolbachia endosymbiont of Folsomia candida]|uniref:hypothetical protein n=1 Tax=Wolbachia endosymbiont of Folsomia candida TaxID=169402 RepID=UPI000A815C4A|nr:hypothetical protein [Wolbachia endosymbiont of Folsomia candida]APR97978.1 hypothetical protein ASM33_01475 [Wolbachia endosymbiont of Folsomia candida]